MSHSTDNLRIIDSRPLVAPEMLSHEFPVTLKVAELVTATRQAASAIIKGEDERLIVVVGPCSIHDTQAALQYADLLKASQQQLASELLIIMRIYFEKPRTTVGWKGLINDPYLDNSFDINQGLRIARGLLIDLAEQGMPAATEFLDTIVPQYISDLIAWGAIGARTTESQIHRELASGLSMPVGFKNGTGGSLQIAIDAIKAAQSSHHFLGVTKHGSASILKTAGNDTCHVILRGGKTGPNYQTAHIQETKALQDKAQIKACIMVDCSHGNSEKDHRRQAVVAADICQQLRAGETAIGGVMLESHLVAGTQSLKDKSQLVYGQSITDACLDWEATHHILEQLAAAVKVRRAF